MTIERHIYIISGYQPLHDDKFYYTLMYPAALHGWVSLLRELISWAAVTVNDATANGITVLSASVTGIALNGVNRSVFHTLNNSHMVGYAITLPIKEDDLTCRRFKITVLPKPPILEPLGTLHTACKFRDNTRFNIAALIGAPAHKAGAPFHTAAKTVPAPIWFAANISHL